MNTLNYDYVVLISIDTLRSDILKSNPQPLWPTKYPRATAPNNSVLDEFAASGVYFANAVTAAPYTGSSHATLFTGQFPLRHGLYEFYNGQLQSPTIFTYAKASGYRTILKVDFPIILGSQLGFTRDVDDYLVEDDDGFIEALFANNRSVACAHFAGLHAPYGYHTLRFGGDHHRAKVKELESEVPASVPLPRDQLTETYRDGEDEELHLRYKRAVQHLYEAGHYDRLFDLYLEGVDFFFANRFERFLRRLISRLESSGKRFLITLTGDHGHEFDANSCGHFNSLAEGVLRVPMILAGSDLPQAVVRSARVRTVDFLPTLLELMGQSTVPPQSFDGISLCGTNHHFDGATSLPTIAQTYTADTTEFLKFQKRQLRGLPPGPLPHVLLAEAAYVSDLKLTRTHSRYRPGFAGMQPTEQSQVERIGHDGRLEAFRGPRPTELDAVLDAYNRKRRPSAPVSAGEDVRRGLRNLGYHV